MLNVIAAVVLALQEGKVEDWILFVRPPPGSGVGPANPRQEGDGQLGPEGGEGEHPQPPREL